MITETLTGAFATTELVGRETELKTILERIQDESKTRPCIIFLEGPGGIGKTRLLREMIQRCKDMPGVKISDPLIDAYHLRVHTPIEFVQDLYQSLTPLDDSFRKYERDARVLGNIRLSGEAVQVEEQVQTALDSFIEGLKSFVENKKQRVVILLDTLERFAYGTDIPDVPESAETWTWLTDRLKALPNVILLVAGREEARPLLRGLDASIEVLPISLDTFSLEEAQAYFQAAAATARRNSAERVARSLASLIPQEVEQAHALSGGRPILLALAADYVASGGLLQSLFDATRAAKDKTPQECFKDEILKRLLGLERLGEIIRSMALTPKGLDADLLRIILNLPRSRFDVAETHLLEIEQFSFVKHRYDPREQTKTYYLHDEVYDMLKGAAFIAFPAPGRDEKNEIYKRVIEYYEERFKMVRRALGDAYTQLQAGGESEIDWNELQALLSQRSETLLSLLYYRLRQNPPKGYRRWVRYDHEAVIGGDLEFALQLQLELSAYLRELAAGTEAQDQDWDGDLVHWSLRLAPVKRAWARGKSDEVLNEVQKIETAYPQDLQDPLKKAMLLVWKAYASADSKPQEACAEAGKILDSLKPVVEAKDEIHTWLAKMLMAFAHRIRGYAYRVQEQIEQAIADYRQAAVLLREVDLKIETATVNNDLGYALMLKGDSSDARSLAENALGLRSEMGLGAQVAYSVNTLALIDTYEGRYSEAIENATKALNLFRAVKNKRGIGLALIALAEATRRQCGALTGEPTDKRLDRLNRAFQHAEEALAIFEELGATSRQVEALIEMGCARRDAVRLIRESGISTYGAEKFIKASQDALEDAAERASLLVQSSQVHHRQVDALVNLAWLGFYAGDDGESIREEAEKRAEELLRAYELLPGKSQPEIFGKPDYQPLLSTQLGKLHVLRGHRIYAVHQAAWQVRLDHPTRKPDEKEMEKFRQVYADLAREYFLGLEHSALYSPEYRDLRLAKQQIFDRLKVLRAENLQVFEACLGELEQKHNLSDPSQLRQMLVKRALLAK